MVPLNQQEIEKIIQLAQELQDSRSNSQENLFAERMGPIIKSPESKYFLIRLMDVAFRSNNYARISAYVVKLFNENRQHQKLFNGYEKLMIRLFRMIGYKLPSVSIPVMLQQVQEVTKPIVFFVGDQKFNDHAKSRKEEGIQLNINLIGEALIGEKEAQERIEAYCALLEQKNVNYISIKISTIYSQINSLAFEHSVQQLVKRLSILYDKVVEVYESTGEWKFVNLDMEEYRDLDMTIETFIRTLSIPRFQKLRMGIVLQAYIPDSYEKSIELQKWAKERIESGGAPIKIRIVKGANMEMEKTESSLENWPLVTFREKKETDANFKKILLNLLQKDSLTSVHLGIASHNIFDVAFAAYHIKKEDLAEFVDFEMLEGMANATVDALVSYKMNVLLYTPIVEKKHYTSAIAYLVRRLDEGTQAGNFLREGFNLQVNSKKWEELKDQFITSVQYIDEVNEKPYRRQDRNIEAYLTQKKFKNAANTDWNLPQNRSWIKTLSEKWQNNTNAFESLIQLQGNLETKKRQQISISNWQGTLPWLYELADKDDYRQFITSSGTWNTFTIKKKAEILKLAAVEIAKKRGDLISIGIIELGKTVQEMDVEISEAIDFANYYAQSMVDISENYTVNIKDGLHLILAPWNFPVAIPIGGVLASLAAHKRVILKPSQNAIACSYMICQCLWKAGVPHDSLSLLPTKESNLDSFLTPPDVFDAVILTGSTDTAQMLLNRQPFLPLYAETGGKNATIITALADKEQAIKNVIQSAFGNTGQKCSATSLLILEKEVFENEDFKSLLKDAAESLTVGSPWNLETKVGPLATPISKKIKKIIKSIPDEQWLVKPVVKDEYFLTHGIIWGVTEHDEVYQEELFGPILGVMASTGLKEAIDLVNKVPYGLTSGLESLDPDEIKYWKEHIQAGNLYINRTTTGAIVHRQPFGGMKASNFGFGMKAGGPNYVLQFTDIEENLDSSVETTWLEYQEIYQSSFHKEIDEAKIRGQHNIFRYRKPSSVIILLDNDTLQRDLEITERLCKLLKVKYSFYSLSPTTHIHQLDSKINVCSSWLELTNKIDNTTRIRSLLSNTISDEFINWCHLNTVHIYQKPVSPYGSLEFLNYLREQSISHNFHRYGNLLGETH